MDTSKALEVACNMNRWRHDVFLSFRGKDTRKTFTDNLYERLKEHGVNVFIDKELPLGENISEELVETIRRSRISVIVFSSRYAESTWCLQELEEIMECKRNLGQKVLPIFYDVDATDVRHQITGTFAEALQTHELNFLQDHPDKVKRWRSALTEAANLSGGNLRNTLGFEGTLVTKIINKIKRILNKVKSLNVATHHVEIESRVQDISNYLRDGRSDDVRFIGILGMVGMGKTTFAKEIFNKFHGEFDDNCFLSEVRERDILALQNQLLCDILKPANKEVRSVDEGIDEIKRELSSKRVLVIFDGIDCPDHLDKLALKRNSFGAGSRIIITTRNKDLLKKVPVDKTCLVGEMNNKEARELLCWHAFGNSCPPDKEFLALSKKVVKYCGGLPLALKVLGSYLHTKSKGAWKCALRSWKKHPHVEMHTNLKISYDGLIDNAVKAIFLDIACFFIGMNKDRVMKILDGCNFDPRFGIGELHDRCLVSVDEGNNLVMHDLLRDMGREIVQEEYPNSPERRKRLWNHEDVKDVLRDKSGTKEIEGLAVDLQESNEPSFSTDAFINMKKLRLLKLKGVNFTGGCEHLPKRLRWLCWPGFHLQAVPKEFNQPKLVDIDLSHSHIQVWTESNELLERLKFLNLSYSNNLEQTPDFSKLPNLEKLILHDCKNLSKVHDSILQLKNLKYLYLANCKKLKDGAIPNDLGELSSLQVLDLRGNDFNGLPILSGLSRLQTLQLDNCTNLQEIPELPINLKILEANECMELARMPDFSQMSSMRELHLNHCPKLTHIPGLEKLLNSMIRIHMKGCTNLTADFVQAIRQGWSKDKNGGLLLPQDDFPSRFEYNEDSYDENRSCKRLRCDPSEIEV